MRIATRDANFKDFQIGQFIRGNVWLQANIHNIKQ